MTYIEPRFGEKAPFPWFGGKSKAAPLVWELLGDVDHYCEPFAGSLAVLLGRPHECNRAYYSESVNDLDGFICNAWRSIALSPDATAEAASWPVCDADKTARHIRLLRWRQEHNLDLLAGDPEWHDPVMGGWWLWAVAVQIGAFSGDGPWTADPRTGRIVKQSRDGAREPGVSRNRPHLSDNGQGVNNQTLREPGVSRNRPHLSDNGQGVNHAVMRELGVGEPQYHPMTMPKLCAWFRLLSARLRHVRILNGDWSRLVTTGASHTLSVRMGGHVGIFLDPPYAGDIRAGGLYANDDGNVAAEVREWCIKHGDNPTKRIVLTGYDTEHGDLASHGWQCYEWFEYDDYLAGGMGEQQHRERMWASPHCLGRRANPQMDLFAAANLSMPLGLKAAE